MTHWSRDLLLRQQDPLKHFISALGADTDLCTRVLSHPLKVSVRKRKAAPKDQMLLVLEHRANIGQVL